ncbi:MAG: enoyl-CoA hydratase-related protein [Dehalococcoidia bacterium]
MDFETIILTRENHIATLTLNRPEKKNAINSVMERELAAALEDIGRDPDVRVMVLKGAGEKVFCSGGDISDTGPERMGSTAQEISTALRNLYRDVMLPLYELEIPTIASVQGAASSWGFDLILACDLRVGTENARFNEGFARVGLTPATGGVWLLPRVVGLPKAAELIFTAEMVHAREAERFGILNRVVTTKELEKETMELATRIAQMPPLAIRLSKLQLRRGLQTDFSAALDLAAQCQGLCITSEDSREAIAAMMEKREAQFKGK